MKRTAHRVNQYLANSYKKTKILTPDEKQGVQKLNEELRGRKFEIAQK